MQKPTLKTQPRKVFGRKVKQLRSDGILPANIYGKKIKSQAIQARTTDFEKVFEKAGESGLVELIVSGKKKPVLIHNVQLDPVTDTAIHADFLQVNLKEKVTAQVSVELLGESPAEKESGGTVVQHIDEIEVEALPTDLPEKFEVNLTKLKEIDATIKISDLEVDKKKVEIKNDPDQIIVKVEPPMKVEEEALPAEEEVPEGEEVTVEEMPVKAGEEDKKEKEDKEASDDKSVRSEGRTVESKGKKEIKASGPKKP